MTRQPACRAAGGFTLLEIMVVIFIIGILATLVTLAIGNRPIDDRLDNEAARIEQLLRMAQDDAEVRGIAIGVRLTQDGYEFMAQDDKSHWVDYTQDGSLHPRRFTYPFVAQLQIEGRLVPPAQDAQSGDLNLDDPKKIRPQILLLPGGESTEFAIDVGAPGYPVYYHIEADALGHLLRERRVAAQ